MDTFFCPILPTTGCRRKRFFLACTWILGLMAGSACSVHSGTLLTSLMRTAASSRVSIVGLMSAVLLPLLFSAAAVYISNIWLLIPIAFSKAFLFAYFAAGLTLSFGSAGWLIRFLFMFSDCMILPLLWWYWICFIDGRNRLFYRDTAVALAVAVMIGCFDYCTVSPFLASLL